MTRPFIFACVLIGLASGAAARDEQCLAALHERAQACTESCVAKARAAVDPSVRDQIIGRACAKNCLKMQMFQGQTCG